MELPLVANVKQTVSAPWIEDLEVEVGRRISSLIQKNRQGIEGKNIAITAGSRGIDRIPIILGTIVHHLKSAGARPFLIPAMGSHGGADAGGQKEVLASIGVTEEAVGAPVISSLDTVQVGVTPSGIPVFADKLAARADGVILVNRIKPHTEFKGEIESGLIKMAAIGLGKYRGATVIHNFALRRGYERAITEAAGVVLAKLPVLFGLAVIENCYDRVAVVEAVPKQDMFEQEKKLLLKARSLMMSLPFKNIDVLVVDEIGKNISGTGMDTNIIGRVMVYGQKEPEIPDIIRIVALDFTPGAHGNATGIGLADFTTEKLIGKIDRESTVVNCIAACTPEKARLPIALTTDLEAVQCALRTVGLESTVDARLVHIKNTLDLRIMEVSEALLPEVHGNNRLSVLEKPRPLAFTGEGGLLPVSTNE